MAVNDPRMIRNIAFVGHGGAGKTSLVEGLLYDAKVTTRLGRVDDGTSIMDFEPEEVRRHKSLKTSVCHVEWKKHWINMIDTPGDSNFIAETSMALEAVDGVVLTIEAVDGVKVQTEKVWNASKELKLSGLIFINKMDRERADFKKTIEDIKNILKVKPLVLQLPVGSEDGFRGVIDLVSMKAHIYEPDASGKSKITDIPSEYLEEAEGMREKMIEDVAEIEDALTEKYLEEGGLSKEELLSGLRQGSLAGHFMPVLCGSALKNVGLPLILDQIIELLPSPAEREAKEGIDPETEQKQARSPLAEEAFSALVFKTISDPYTGKLSLFRIFSGSLTPDTILYNPNKKVKERVGQILLLEGKNQKPADGVGPGSIVAVAKLKDTKSGDTLCSEKAPILFRARPLPPAIFAYAIKPKTKEDEDKAAASLQRLIEEDITLSVERDEQTKEFILKGMGRTHLEVAVEKLKRKFGIEVELKTPKVPYKETIKATRTGVIYRHKKQTGGRGQFAEVHFDISPLPRGQGFEFKEDLTGMNVPRNFVPAVEKGIVEALQNGVIAGYPITDIRVRFYDGKSHEVDSSEIAFKIAASMCLKKGISEANPVLLEPIMNLEITVPEENMGDIIGDLNSRRGRVLGMDSKGGIQVIRAQVPYSEILMYEPDLTSITSGRGSFVMEFSHYEEVPAHLSEKIIALAKEAKEE